MPSVPAAQEPAGKHHSHKQFYCMLWSSIFIGIERAKCQSVFFLQSFKTGVKSQVSTQLRLELTGCLGLNSIVSMSKL